MVVGPLGKWWSRIYRCEITFPSLVNFLLGESSRIKNPTFSVTVLLSFWRYVPTQFFPRQSHRSPLRLPLPQYRPSNASIGLTIPDLLMRRELLLPHAYTLHPHLSPRGRPSEKVRQLDCSFAPGSRQVHALAEQRVMTRRRQ